MMLGEMFNGTAEEKRKQIKDYLVEKMPFAGPWELCGLFDYYRLSKTFPDAAQMMANLDRAKVVSALFRVPIESDVVPTGYAIYADCGQEKLTLIWKEEQHD